jgi:hypothetical protein
VAEKIESLEDIVAEARARRETLDAGTLAAAAAADNQDGAEDTDDEPVATGRARRRANGHVRRRHT